MSDFNSSLPVRTQTNGDVVAFLADGTTPTQLLAINASGQLALTVQGSASGGTAASFSNLAGGIYNTALPTLTNGQQAALQLDSSGRLLVDVGTSSTVTVNQGTSPWIVKDQADGSVSGGAAGSFSLLAGLIYNSTPLTLTNGQQASLQGDVNGYLKVDLATALPAGANVIGAVTQSAGPWTQNLTQVGGSAVALGQTTMAASIPVTIASNQTALSVTTTNFPTTVDTNYGTVGASTIRTASQIGNATGAANFGNGATGAQTLRVAANLAVGGTDVSSTNPVPVEISPIILGTPVDNYNTSASLASGGTSNHDYTVTAAKTFYSKQFWATASGKLKIEVQYETGAATNVFNTFWVGFNSTSTPNIYVPVPSEKTQVTGARIRIIRTNEDKSSMDVYSTTSGTEQ